MNKKKIAENATLFSFLKNLRILLKLLEETILEVTIPPSGNWREIEHVRP